MPNVKWTVLNLGNISRNLFWGEDKETPRRSAICTSTLLKIRNTLIIVDPPFADLEMADLLDRRTGLKAEDIDIVFMTHTHGDHTIGLGAFDRADYYMAKGEIEKIGEVELNKRPILKKLKPVGENLVPGIEAVILPGHTDNLTGLIFSATEGRVAVVGDAVMTRDFFVARRGYFNSIDFAAASNTITKLSQIADVIVPGHDNSFRV